MDYKTSPSTNFQGQNCVPGDKSISHRSIILGAIAEGTTTVRGFLRGEDCLATAKAFSEMGVEIVNIEKDEMFIHGVGLCGLQEPNTTLNLGNSGTSMRLLAGLLVGQNFATTLTGDNSLCQRPMQRVVKPLLDMGADIRASEEGTAPLSIQPVQERPGQALRAIQYQSPIASAQVKSCLLLAGLYADGITTIEEPKKSRDHTERMLNGFAVDITEVDNRVSIQGNQVLKACEIDIPGDISSAAFFIVAACIAANAKIQLNNVGINPTRTGVISILQAMGANIQIVNERMVCGEKIANILVESSNLNGIEIPSQYIASAIDEFPIIFIAAAMANGKTILRNAGELRVKESDRIHSMAIGLQKLGIVCEELTDGLIIEGGTIESGEIDCFHDHRIAMAFAVAGLVANGSIVIRNVDNVATSFPSFSQLYEFFGGHIETLNHDN